MQKITNNSLMLVDGSFYLYRAYHVFRFLKNSKGELTGAIYGFIHMLQNLLMQCQCDHIAIAFDTHGQTFRNEIFEKYKKNRPTMPKDLLIQIPILYDILKSMGISLLEMSGVEADDVIGSLALKAENKGYKVFISTGDKDMAQLVSPNIALINTIHQTLLGPKEVELKYGVLPPLIVDLLAIMGDTSDNIPGILGIGKKTAQILIHHLGSISKIYNNLEKISTLPLRGAQTIQKQLKKNRDIVFLSYKLAKIKTDLTLECLIEQLIFKDPNISTLKNLFYRYEFKKWLKDIEAGQWIFQKKILH